MDDGFQHVKSHTALPESVHFRIAENLVNTANEMVEVYQCDLSEAWLRIAIVAQRALERLSNEKVSNE